MTANKWQTINFGVNYPFEFLMIHDETWFWWKTLHAVYAVKRKRWKILKPSISNLQKNNKEREILCLNLVDILSPYLIKLAKQV